jgi:hypothetical protein
MSTNIRTDVGILLAFLIGSGIGALTFWSGFRDVLPMVSLFEWLNIAMGVFYLVWMGTAAGVHTGS